MWRASNFLSTAIASSNRTAEYWITGAKVSSKSTLIFCPHPLDTNEFWTFRYCHLRQSSLDTPILLSKPFRLFDEWPCSILNARQILFLHTRLIRWLFAIPEVPSSFQGIRRLWKWWLSLTLGHIVCTPLHCLRIRWRWAFLISGQTFRQFVTPMHMSMLQIEQGVRIRLADHSTKHTVLCNCWSILDTHF